MRLERIVSARVMRAMMATGVLSLAASTGLAAYVPGDALVNPGLTGTTEYAGWVGLTIANYPGYPGFPGSGAWSTPMAANQPGSGDATLNKTANGTGGGPYPASGAIYFGGFSDVVNNNGGQLTVADATPVPGLQTVALQVSIGEAWAHDFFNDVLPTLSYNGGAQNLAATTSLLTDQFFNGTVEMPTGTENVYINTYLLTWDLSPIGDAISSFAVSFNGVQHAQVYALQLDQSDSLAIPEPGTLALAVVGAWACWSWPANVRSVGGARSRRTTRLLRCNGLQGNQHGLRAVVPWPVSYPGRGTHGLAWQRFEIDFVNSKHLHE
jgi:hypothetical protein